MRKWLVPRVRYCAYDGFIVVTCYHLIQDTDVGVSGVKYSNGKEKTGNDGEVPPAQPKVSSWSQVIKNAPVSSSTNNFKLEYLPIP